MHKDQDYVVKDDEILIVDEFTGRIMPGRRYSDGLHPVSYTHLDVYKRQSQSISLMSEILL